MLLTKKPYIFRALETDRMNTSTERERRPGFHEGCQKKVNELERRIYES